MKLQDPINSLDPADPALAELGDWLFNPGGDEQAKIRTAREVFGRLFLPGPPHSGPDSQQREAFDGLIDSFASSEEPDLHYDLPYPKWEFLQHLTTSHDFLLHGSRRALSKLEPRPQDDWSGQPIQAVFATSDPVWSIFFATINRTAINGDIRNGGLLIATPQATPERYYFFSVATGETPLQVLQPGYVHLLKREGFTTSAGPVRFDEWHGQEPAPVVKRLPVSAEDFPFADHIARHPEEPVLATWSNYLERSLSIDGQTAKQPTVVDGNQLRTLVNEESK